MPGNSDPSRIFRDPALTDRRGDATGPVALLFLVLVVGVFAAVTWGLVTYLPVVADPSPQPTASASATPRATPTPRPTETPGPSTAIEPTSVPVASDGPLPTRGPRATEGPLPSRAPVATATPRPPKRGAIDQIVPVVRDGRRLGTVTLTSFAAAPLPGVDLPGGARVMVAQVTYASADGMPYDASDWFIEDADGKRYPSLGDQAPDPALGSGQVSAGGTVSGGVAFIRERRVLIQSIVLTDGAGTDLVVIERPPVP